MFDVPEVLEVQVVASVEVRMVPLSPTVTKVMFSKMTILRLFDVPEVLEAQVIASGEVSRVPEAPTARNESFDVVEDESSDDLHDETNTVILAINTSHL